MRARSALILGMFYALSSSTPSQQVGGGLYAYEQFFGAAAGEGMGYSVANAGDVNADGIDDYIIGAIHVEVSGMTDAGAAYVYSGADASLIYTFLGVVPDGNFGFSVAGAGDVNADGFDDVIIGAPYVSPVGSPNEGRAYVYSGATGLKLYRFDGRSAEDRLGFSVAGAGDVNGDGRADLLVGSIWSAESGLPQSGCVDLYSGLNGSVIHHWDGGSPNDFFGYSVAGAGDANGNPDSGRVYLYSGVTGAKLQRLDGDAAYDWLGFAVAAAGDVNQDGFDDFFVGAPLNDANGLIDAGCAKVYSGKNANLIMQLDGPAAEQHFGSALAGDLDLNSDGVPDLLVGAPGADPGSAPYAGSATAFSGADSEVLLQAWGREGNDLLGRSVALLPNLNQHPLGEILVGAHGLDYGANLDVGWAGVMGYSPYFRSDVDQVSAASGATITFSLQFPQEFAQTAYKVLGSATGTGPTQLAGIDVPLTAGDFLWDALLASPPPPIFAGANGTLNASGEAICLLTLPPGFADVYVGTTFYFAAALYQPPATGLLSSAVATLTIQP